MKIISVKSTFAAVVTAATLFTSGVATVSTAHAESPLIRPGVVDRCVIRPALCGGGPVVRPVRPGGLRPLAPAPKPPKRSGLSRDQKIGLGIVGGLLAGAAIANAAKAKPNNGPYNQHLAYCQGKYKSYDIGSNSYMSYSGVRKLCVSPYLR